MNLTHYVDLVRYVTGAEAAWVTAVARTDAGAEVEDAVALTVSVRRRRDRVARRLGRHARGAGLAFRGLGGDGHDPARAGGARLHGARRLDVVAGRWNALRRRRVRARRRGRSSSSASRAAVLAGERPDVTAADGLAVQAFVEAAYRSVREGRPVRVEPAVARESV